MELLNLDELAAVVRKVKLKGETYVLADRQVGQMVEAIQRVKQFDKAQESGSELDVSEALAINLIESSQQLLPDCPRDVLEACSMRQLSALLEFANVADSEIVEEAEEKKVTKKKEEKTVETIEGK